MNDETTAASPALPRSLGVETGHSSRLGPRERNEDYVGVFLGRPEQRSTRGVVAAVADGVSGGRGSRVAAELAVRSFIEGYVGDLATRSVKQIAGQSLLAVNTWIHGIGRADPDLAGMATTLTLLILRGRTAHIVHVGDSRLYRWRHDELVRLTTDHVLNRFEGRHVLTRSIGGQADVMVDYAAETLQAGDRFLLCTDGVHGVLNDRALAAHLRAEAPPAGVAEAITAAALAAHGSDNTTALVVDVTSVPEARLADVESAVAALPIQPPPKVGDIVDGLRMDRLVADGFHTRVFKATDVERQTVVLAKFPKEHVVGDSVMRQAFVRENWISSLVLSPYVGQGLERDRSQLYSLMHWYEGETLESRLGHQPAIGAVAGIAIATKLLKGVVSLHRAGIVHRDIKPENVILEANGGIRLVDLGVARIPHLEDFRETVAPGTPNYMAPELYAGGLGNERSDLFAVGVTIFRMFTGAYPYAEIDALARPSFRQGASLAKRRPDLPGWLGPILARAYAFQPQERQNDAIELLFDLEHGQLAGSAAPAAWLPLYHRNPVLAWKIISAALALLLAVLLVAAATPRAPWPRAATHGFNPPRSGSSAPR